MQGGQIFDDSFCGGGDLNEGYTNTAVPLSASAVNMIKAAIFMGDPRYRYGFTYDVGTCTAYGVSHPYPHQKYSFIYSWLNYSSFTHSVFYSSHVFKLGVDT
jgi:hypothetical protein